MQRTTQIATIVMALVAIVTVNAAASTTFPLTQWYPDINAASGVTLSYDADTDTLTGAGVPIVSGFPTTSLQLTEASEGTSSPDPGDTHPGAGLWTLNAVVSETGVLTSGTLDITDATFAGIGSGINITFTWIEAYTVSGVLQFAGHVTTSNIPDYFPLGWWSGAIIAGPNLDLSDDFTDINASANAFIPAPAALPAGVLGLTLLALRRRRAA